MAISELDAVRDRLAIHRVKIAVMLLVAMARPEIVHAAINDARCIRPPRDMRQSIGMDETRRRKERLRPLQGLAFIIERDETALGAEALIEEGELTPSIRAKKRAMGRIVQPEAGFGRSERRLHERNSLDGGRAPSIAQSTESMPPST